MKCRPSRLQWEASINSDTVGRADLHIHTAHGDGMAQVPELLDYVEAETDLEFIAITEQDEVRWALQAREVWARGNYRFELVTGVEVTAIEGHLIALYVEEPLPSLRPLAEVIEAVHRQGGLCIIPHPMSWMTRSLGRRAIQRICGDRRDGVCFDGIETANQTPAARVSARRAAELNRRMFNLAEVGGSDAHFLPVIGSAYTEFPGRTAQDLRRALGGRTTRGVSGVYPSLRQIGLGQVLRQTWRGINVTPRTMGWRRTAGSFIQRMLHHG